MGSYGEKKMTGDKPSVAIDLREFRIGWRIVLLSLVGVGTSAAVMPLYGFGAMVVPLEQAFGWDRGALLATASFLSLGAVISSQLAGWLNRAYGMRPVALASMVTLSLMFLFMSQIDRMGGSILILYGCFLLGTFAGIGTLQITWTQLTNLWFDKNRGLALAIVLSGSGVAAIVLPSLITAVVEQWSWRAGFISLALIPILITFPLAWFWLTPTDSNGTASTPMPGVPAVEIPGIAFSTAVRSARYWLINGSMVLVASAIMIMVINTVPLLRDKGFSAIEAGSIFSTFGISLVAGRVFVGYLIDRLWAPGVAWVALSLPAIGCVMLYMIDDNIAYLIFGVMLIGAGAGAEYDIAAFLVARYFGMRDYARLFGVQMGAISGGVCIAPTFAAWLYGASGSYASILLVNAALFLVGAALLLGLGRYPRFPTPIRLEG